MTTPLFTSTSFLSVDNISTPATIYPPSEDKQQEEWDWSNLINFAPSTPAQLDNSASSTTSTAAVPHSPQPYYPSPTSNSNAPSPASNYTPSPVSTPPSVPSPTNVPSPTPSFVPAMSVTPSAHQLDNENNPQTRKRRKREISIFLMIL